MYTYDNLDNWRISLVKNKYFLYWAWWQILRPWKRPLRIRPQVEYVIGTRLQPHANEIKTILTRSLSLNVFFLNMSEKYFYNILLSSAWISLLFRLQFVSDIQFQIHYFILETIRVCVCGSLQRCQISVG